MKKAKRKYTKRSAKWNLGKRKPGRPPLTINKLKGLMGNCETVMLPSFSKLTPVDDAITSFLTDEIETRQQEIELIRGMIKARRGA